MDVFEAIRTLLAVRRYQDRPVPEPVIRTVLEAGRLTASASNKQPWHFVVVQDPEMLRKFGEVMPQNAPYVADAPLAIVVAITPSPIAMSDASRAIQSMLLAAWAEGVGGNWTGNRSVLVPVKALLGIPDELDVVAIVPLGYPADAIGKGKKNRKPLAEIAHRERWDEPFA
jgi:nitroreductase